MVFDVSWTCDANADDADKEFLTSRRANFNNAELVKISKKRNARLTP